MKKLNAILFLLITTVSNLDASACGRLNTKFKQDFPQELIAPGDGFWRFGTLSSINFHDRYTGASRNGGGVSVFFKFSRNGTYKFMLLVQANSYGTMTKTFTEVEGTFTVGQVTLSDGKIHKTVILKPIKGSDEISSAYKNTKKPIPLSQMKSRGLMASYAFGRYIKDGKQFLDMLDMSDNKLTSFHEEY